MPRKKRGGSKIDELPCAHNIEADKWGTCFDEDTLIKIANAYNKKHSNKIPTNISKAVLIKEIKIRFQESCNRQDGLCWISNVKDTLPDANTIVKERFKPERPKGKKEWLSTFDIADVMQQFEKKHTDFAFFGPFPVDFMVVLKELPFQNLKKLQNNGINKVGMIFNLDKHDEPGSHWVAYFLNLNSKNPSVEYFDSVGRKPPQEIEKFMNDIIRNAYINLHFSLDKKINTIQHQKKDTECGVYSLYFIIERLNGRTFDNICVKIIPDDKMNDFRNLYFRPNGTFK